LQRELALDLVVGLPGDADATGLGDRFEPSGDVYAVADDVLAFDQHVAEIDADAEEHPAIRRHVRVPLGHPTLNLDSTAEGVHYTRKLHEHAVSSGLDDPASVLGDLGVYKGSAVGLQLSERPFLVSSHEPGVPGDIGSQDGCQPTPYALGGGHTVLPVGGTEHTSTSRRTEFLPDRDRLGPSKTPALRAMVFLGGAGASLALSRPLPFRTQPA
jgi:hypothetical protein